jgi:hypothetical protein
MDDDELAAAERRLQELLDTTLDEVGQAEELERQRAKQVCESISGLSTLSEGFIPSDLPVTCLARPRSDRRFSRRMSPSAQSRSRPSNKFRSLRMCACTDTCRHTHSAVCGVLPLILPVWRRLAPRPRPLTLCLSLALAFSRSLALHTNLCPPSLLHMYVHVALCEYTDTHGRPLTPQSESRAARHFQPKARSADLLCLRLRL